MERSFNVNPHAHGSEYRAKVQESTEVQGGEENNGSFEERKGKRNSASQQCQYFFLSLNAVA